MAIVKISASRCSKWTFQKSKSVIFRRNNDWAHGQVSQRPLTASKMAFEVLENLPVLKNGHCLGKSWSIFDFLDNFPHYSSSRRSFVSMKWPPEGLKLSYGIFRRRDLSWSLGTQPMECPPWKGPQKFPFFSKIILRCGTLLKAVVKVFKLSKN